MKYIYPGDRLPTPVNSKLLALVGEKKKVLEVGCALGYQTRSMKELQGCQVTGIEIDADAANLSRPYCDDLIVGDIETMDLDQALHDKLFDVITFADVLEHLKDPVATLRKVSPFLQDGGYVIASIPNIAHSSVIFEMAKGLFEYRSLGLLDNTHIHFFTRQTIYHAFENAGYLIVELDRNILSAANTEFKTNPKNDDDLKFLDYINNHNQEAETYQFVLKAIRSDNKSALQSEILTAQERVKNLENDSALNRKQIDRLESDLKWITNRPIYKLLTSFVKFIKR